MKKGKFLASVLSFTLIFISILVALSFIYSSRSKQDLKFNKYYKSSVATVELLEEVVESDASFYLLLFDNTETGIEETKEKYELLSQLLAKDDLLLAIETYIENHELTFIKSSFIRGVLDYINCEDAALLSLTETTVYTPKGSAVPAYIRTEELTQSDKNEIKELARREYPNAVYKREATTKYNCHSYAWYSQATDNNIWINYPLSFKTDGSYPVGDFMVGGKIVYTENGEDTHSAIITKIEGSSLSQITVISKWGAWGLYEHKVTESPYYKSGVTISSYLNHQHNMSKWVLENMLFHKRECTICGYVERQRHGTNKFGLCNACGAKIPQSPEINAIGGSLI